MATYNKKTIEDIDVAGKTVLVRCDFNVPMKDGVITSDKRIVGALPTIQYLMEKGAKVFEGGAGGDFLKKVPPCILSKKIVPK